MGRMYTVEFSDTAVATASGDVDFFEILPAANKPIRVHAVYLSQSSDVGDAAEEMLRVKIMRLPATVTSGTGGSSATPVPLDVNDAASGATCEVLNTAVATTSGTGLDVHPDAFNIRVGWPYMPTPEMRLRAQNTEAIIVRLMAAVTDELTMSGVLYFEEL